MIILNQDKDSLYNFNNVKSIDVLGNEIYLTDDILADEGTRVAIYKTEERAKEVLQEIIERYEHTQYIKGFGREIDCYEVGIKDFAYEMPKE